MEIMKVKNYKNFAQMLSEKTKCEMLIKIINKEHTHFQLNKDGISMGVLCVNQGETSFAPFVTHENVKDSQYINVQYMPMLEDFIVILTVFDELFVVDKSY